LLPRIAAGKQAKRNATENKGHRPIKWTSMTFNSKLVPYMNAWMLTWEGTVEPATSQNSKIVAILSSRISEKAIESMVDVLYRRTVETAFDMAFLAKKSKERRGQYRNMCSSPGRLYFGRNPCIFARQVTNLKISRDITANTESITWTDLPVFGNADKGAGIKELIPARECQVVRVQRALSHEFRSEA
jgi:hypothetical protein